MLLTLQQAATRLGKSPRQVRYLIQSQRLRARKVEGRWVVDADDLPLTAGQREAVARQERGLRAAVDEGLGLTDDGQRPPRYSVRDLKAFQIALPIRQKAADALGPEHPACLALHRVLEALAEGCHRFDREAKSEAYRQARDAASRAVCELVLATDATADALVTRIEQDLMAALAGLLRRAERRRPR